MKTRMRLNIAVISAALLLAARVGLADTISIHDLSENTATGVFQYTITLDAAADVQDGDGFAIYDFTGETSFSITGLNNDDFSLTQTSTSNALTDPSKVDSVADVSAIVNSIPLSDLSIDNLSFAYDGPGALVGAQSGILTVDTDVLGATALGVYASIDHSGISIDNPFGLAEGPILTPAPGLAPPTSSVPEINLGGLGSLAMIVFGALALMENRKSGISKA
jgi:hypothetical protein